jgi:hypothetical protein
VVANKLPAKKKGLTINWLNPYYNWRAWQDCHPTKRDDAARLIYLIGFMEFETEESLARLAGFVAFRWTAKPF